MNGLSTLNRLLGKRNKDVSKSTSNLSRSTTNLEASSHYNHRIIQLPVVPNAPFEQTFRVTVLLPRDQLYVARIGAKTKLSTLLEMVCSDKLLDAQKYVFRHPADLQQGFELDMNIGEVGLSEIRLMSRKELETLRNNEYRLSTSDIFRMHQKSARESSGGGGGGAGGASVTSSELSRTSKMALKTTSPYSSSNSLNSMDSSGVSSSSRGAPTSNGHAGNGHHSHGGAHPVAPTRKKRLAPRPPSQNSIPEVRVPEHNGQPKPSAEDHIFKEPQLPPYSRQNFHVSTPNLYNQQQQQQQQQQQELKSVDILNNNNNVVSKGSNGLERNGYPAEANNNNNLHTHEMLQEEDRRNLINTKTSFSTLKNRPTSMYIIREPPDPSSAVVLQRSSENGGSMMDIHHSHSRASSSCSDAKDPRDFQDMPEPTPRKRLNSSAKKSKAPAPPPRAKTTTISSTVPAPTPSPRVLTRSTLDLLRDNDAAISETDSNFSSEPDDTQRNRESRLNAVNGSVHRAPSSAHQNVSKVMLNVEQTTPLNDTAVTSTTSEIGSERKHQKTGSTASSVSIKIVGQANGEGQQQQRVDSPVKPPTTPIVSKVQIGGEPLAHQPPPKVSSPVDNSSDEEIKIYNIESGKAVVKKKSSAGETVVDQKIKITADTTTKAEQNGVPVKQEPTGSSPPTSGNNAGTAQEEEQWTYRLPAPPTFADSSIKTSDYDERGQFYHPASTFADNTTLRSDMLTVVSDEMTERIEPFIQERLQTMLDLVEGRETEAPAPFFAPSSVVKRSPESGKRTKQKVPEPVVISSDVEDGYRVGETTVPEANGQEARDVWLQTLEKRREKIIEGELATLSESIAGGGKVAGSNSGGVTRGVGSRTESVDERKGSVMSELNQLLREGVELESRTEEKEIAVANSRSSLANFKISTYSSSSSVENKENVITTTTTMTASTVVEKREREYHQEERVKEVVVPKASVVVANNGPTVVESTSLYGSSNHQEPEEESGVIVRRKISVDSIVRKPHSSLTQSSDEDDPAANRTSNGGSSYNHQPGGAGKKEIAPVKRRSLTTLNKSPRGINRSDSFHSTRSDYIQSLNSPAQTGMVTSSLQLTPRSTSYISLIGAQRWENRSTMLTNGNGLSGTFNRRMSTSELSITDSPSLQSLEVIKNILNTSRKSSMNNIHQTPASSEQQRNGDEYALPSMAAIKRNSFTDISTLVQLNPGKLPAGGASVRKDSIEEAKVEQEEPEPEPQREPEQKQPLKQEPPAPKEIIEVVEKKNEVDVRMAITETSVEKVLDEPKKVEQQQQQQQHNAVVEEKEEESVKLRKPETPLQSDKGQTLGVDLASESKSDDEKLQNKQQQKQQQQHAVEPSVTGASANTAKESQTTVVNITTNSTVVSSSGNSANSSSAGVTPTANESDTKKWTYQGPPTISFATWNERPKIDVSIKSDRDYRFGGSSTLPRGFRNVNNVSSTKISIGPGGSSTTTTTTTESSGYVRRTIHEVEPQQQQQSQDHPAVASNVPLTTASAQERHHPMESSAIVKLPATPPKPATSGDTPPGERLPIVRAVEYKKNVTPRQPPPPIEPKPSYFYETFSRNDSSANSSGSNSLVSVNGSAPVSVAPAISRLSFGPKPATVLQPTVRGFKSLDESTIAASTGMPRLRPVSMIDTMNTLRKTNNTPSSSSTTTTVSFTGTPAVPEDTAPNSLPFSQHTLRRTGLKDRILAKDELKGAAEPATGPVQEMVTAVKLNGTGSRAAPAAVRPVSLATSTAAPIPPPPMMPTGKAAHPVVRAAITKKSPATSPAIDPRTALLDAIRNFNKDSLKKE